MANRKNTKSTKTAAKTASRRGRPTNAERAQRVQSQQSNLIDVAVAAASAAVKTALGIDVADGVTSIGVPQGSQSQNASQSTGSVAKTAGRRKQTPGRRVDENSAMSKTRAFYDQNLKSANPMNRADFVRAAADKFGYSRQTANTYVSNIEKDGGYKLVRRGGTGAARGRSRGNGNKSASASATA